jgi:signal recognition particle subunit SRP72
LDGQRIGQESLIEDDYTKEEIEDELAPISVQLAYVQQASLADLLFLLTSNL